MHVHTSEYPRVAHIVADLDTIEAEMDLNLSFGTSATMMFDVRKNRPLTWQVALRTLVSELTGR